MNMRDLFPGYYQRSEDELERIWEGCIFTFDANVLLNIYRYTPKTRERFFDILSKLKDRIWVPYQAAYEYQKNRTIVISQQKSAYQEIEVFLASIITTLNENLSKYSKHAFINIDEIKKIYEDVFGNALAKSLDILNAAKSEHDSEKFDELRDRIDNILDKNIGANYTKDELSKIYKEAEQRFNDKIPPGYKDKSKEIPEKYGDYIIWRQLIDYATAERKPLIFITDDSKEDWWLRHEGEKKGPRPELIQEMHSAAGVIFHTYSSDRFMNRAEEFLKIPHEEEVIEEARNVRLQNEEEELTQEKKRLEKIDLDIAQQSFLELEKILNSTSINSNARIWLNMAEKILEKMPEIAKNNENILRKINPDAVAAILGSKLLDPSVYYTAAYGDALRLASAYSQRKSFNNLLEDIEPNQINSD